MRVTPGKVRDICYGAFLYVATAWFVWRQSARAVPLWDLSFILEYANRMTLGQHPYRDFPFAYPPVTFLIQAVIIRIFGHAVIHHLIYAAVTAGASTLLAWRLIMRVLSGSRLQTRLVAIALTLPLVFFSTNGSLPLPSYDSDCSLFILLFLWFLLRVEQARFPAFGTVVAGVLLVVPVFVKQNTGGAFLIAFLLCLVAYVLLTRRWRALLLAAGALCGLAAALWVIHLECGVSNYFHWTIVFASSRRVGKPRLAFVGYFLHPVDVMYLLLAGAALWQWKRREVDERLVAAALSVPFLWGVVGCLTHHTVLTRFQNMDVIWPVIMVASLGLTVARLGRAREFADLLPIAIVGALVGAFLSQGFAGSSYAVWPFLSILLALMLRAVRSMEAASNAGGMGAGRYGNGRVLEGFSLFVCATLLALGAVFTLSSARLSYIHLSGERHRSSLPALRGLDVPGEYLPAFDELVAYTDRTIPKQDAILLLPGENPFYYATGRVPQFPVLEFDRTINPYNADELVKIARERNVRWLIVEHDYQLRMFAYSRDAAKLLALLAPKLTPVATLQNFTVYRLQE